MNDLLASTIRDLETKLEQHRLKSLERGPKGPQEGWDHGLWNQAYETGAFNSLYEALRDLRKALKEDSGT